MTPAQVQLQIALLPKAGSLPISVLLAPGVHGVSVTGKHGIGVNTPSAAEVAAVTWGLAMELHIPNDGIFTIDK